MQMASREAITRLRDVLPAMKTHRYRYLPCHVPYTCHYSFSCPRGERDEAFEMLVEYLRALEAASDSMVDDLVAARMDSVHGCAANRRELLHTAPPLTSHPRLLIHLPFSPLLVVCLPLRNSTKLLHPLLFALHHLLHPLPYVLLHLFRPLIFRLLRLWHLLHQLSAAFLVWNLLARRKLIPQRHCVSPSAGQGRSSPSPTEYV